MQAEAMQLKAEAMQAAAASARASAEASQAAVTDHTIVMKVTVTMTALMIAGSLTHCDNHTNQTYDCLAG